MREFIFDKERSFYSPTEIFERITLFGGNVLTTELIKEKVLADEISPDIVKVVERLVRTSHKGWDVCVEEFVEKWGVIGQNIVDEALKTGLLRTWQRDTAGPRRHFVRFQVDRNQLLASLRDKTVDSQIEKFWRSVGALSKSGHL